jgi:hypothetical protein
LRENSATRRNRLDRGEAQAIEGSCPVKLEGLGFLASIGASAGELI